MIAQFTAKLAEDTALLQNTMYEGVQKEGERHEICNEMRVEYAKCYKQIKALEEELCGIITIRYATHQKMVPAVKDPVYQDCIVSGWTPGECSKTGPPGAAAPRPAVPTGGARRGCILASGRS